MMHFDNFPKGLDLQYKQHYQNSDHMLQHR